MVFTFDVITQRIGPDICPLVMNYVSGDQSYWKKVFTSVTKHLHVISRMYGQFCSQQEYTSQMKTYGKSYDRTGYYFSQYGIWYTDITMNDTEWYEACLLYGSKKVFHKGLITKKRKRSRYEYNLQSRLLLGD